MAGLDREWAARADALASAWMDFEGVANAGLVEIRAPRGRETGARAAERALRSRVLRMLRNELPSSEQWKGADRRGYVPSINRIG